MRKNPTKDIEQWRICEGVLASHKSDGANGAFCMPMRGGVWITIIASDGSGWNESFGDGKPWEHVSVSTALRCPTWNEMDAVKRIFWRDDETVMQLHVPRAIHVNYHDFCLHLWRPVNQDIPLPPVATVGPKVL